MKRAALIKLPVMKKIKYLLIPTFFTFTHLLSPVYGQAQTEQSQYTNALRLNKSGQYQESAKLLKSLMLHYPQVERYKSDYIAVASNAKLCKEVIAYATPSYLASSPIYVQEAIFNCYASDEPFSKTDTFAKTIVKLQGKNRAIEEKMVSLAQNQSDSLAALYWSHRYLQDFPGDQAAWRARGAILQKQGNEYAALLIYEDINKLAPTNPEVQMQIIQVLLDMGAPSLALDLINQRGWNASKIQKLRAMHNTGAVDLRWSDADSDLAPDRFTSVDMGIEQLTQSLEYAKLIQASDDQIQSIQYDLIVAYTKRKYWTKAIELYDQLLKRGLTIPSYALMDVATSYSAIHQYAKAEAILKEVLLEDPKNMDAQLVLYYSLVDQDQFTQAKIILDSLAIQLKTYPTYLPKINFDYTRALIELANFEAYQEKYQQANQQLKILLDEIPSNADLLKAAGSVSQSEGMHQAAADYYQIAANQDPQDIEARVGYAIARMSQGDIQTLKQTVGELYPGYSDMTSVKNASERLAHDQEGYVTGDFALGNGDFGTQKNNNRTSDLRVYSPTIDDNYRVYARYRDLNSGPAIPVTQQGVGGGIQYTGINREAEVEVGSEGYARAEGTQTLSDHWAVSASYERNAFYLLPGSLYATYAGNVAGMNLKWKNGDTTEAAVGYRYWWLPSNIKQEIYGSASQRLWTEYNYKVDLAGWIGNQQNTNANVSYFSPINQTEYSGTLNLRILQWRDIETKKFDFWHRLFASYGVVTQSGFTTLPMNNYGYGQDFNIGDRRTLSWGVGRTSFPFDGVKSSYITGYLNFEARY